MDKTPSRDGIIPALLKAQEILDSTPAFRYAGELRTKCPVCHEYVTFNQRVVQPCNHSLCTNCATGWFAGHSVCPICRDVIPDNDPLYLMGPVESSPGAETVTDAASLPPWGDMKAVRLPPVADPGSTRCIFCLRRTDNAKDCKLLVTHHKGNLSFASLLVF